jgi:hypothetical protein
MSEPRMTHDEALELAGVYVLGALDPAEEAAVRDHLATCAEPHPEFEALGEVVPALLELGDLELVEPPASLRDRIMVAAAADRAANPRAAAEPRTAERDGPRGRATAEPHAPRAFRTAAEREARAERTRTSRLDWALRIAAVLAIVAVGTWALNVQGQLDAARRFERAVAAVIQVGSQPGANTAILKPGEGATASGIAAVATDGSVVLAMRDLAPTQASQVYEAWVIVGQSAPVPVGGFTVGSDGTAAFTTRPAPTPPGAIIALTLEPNEGNLAPMGPIVSSGVTGAPPGATSRVPSWASPGT